MKRAIKTRLQLLALGLPLTLAATAANATVDLSTALTAMKSDVEANVGAAAPIVLGLVALVIGIGIVIKLVRKG